MNEALLQVVVILSLVILVLIAHVLWFKCLRHLVCKLIGHNKKHYSSFVCCKRCGVLVSSDYRSTFNDKGEG